MTANLGFLTEAAQAHRIVKMPHCWKSHVAAHIRFQISYDKEIYMNSVEKDG